MPQSHKGEVTRSAASRPDLGADTHIHELHVGLGARGLVEDFDGHGDLHRLAFRDPDALIKIKNRILKKCTSNHLKHASLSINPPADGPLMIPIRAGVGLLAFSCSGKTFLHQCRRINEPHCCGQEICLITDDPQNITVAGSRLRSYYGSTNN